MLLEDMTPLLFLAPSLGGEGLLLVLLEPDPKPPSFSPNQQTSTKSWTPQIR